MSPMARIALPSNLSESSFRVSWPVRVPAGDRIPSPSTSADAQYAGAVPYPAGAPLPTSALVGADGPFQVPVRSGGGASRQRASTWESLAAGHRRMPRTPDGLVSGSQVEIGSTYMMRPRRAVAIFGRKGGSTVSGTPRMSAVLLDEAEGIQDSARMLEGRIVAYIDSDGVRTPGELVLLSEFREHQGLTDAHAQRSLMNDTTEEVKERLSGPNGLNGVKAERAIREFYRDRKWLRLVASNDDPDPAGPANVKAA